MNLKYNLLLGLLIIIGPVYAQEGITLNFNSGYIGYGGNFPLTDKYDLRGFYWLVNFGIEHEPTNIGFEFSPYNYFIWTSANEPGRENNEIHRSLFNFNVYWNTITFLDGLIYCGPFASVNYFFVGENFYWDRYIVTVGGQIGLRLTLGRWNYNIVSAGMGYRNISGTSKYFVEAKIDILSVVLFFITMRNSESRNSSSK